MKKKFRRVYYKKSSKKVFFNKFHHIKVELLDKFRKLRRSKRISTYKEKLEEKKKISLLYGNLSQKMIQKTYQQALKYLGKTNENLLVLLESRLDVVLYRICFFKTLHKARQWIQHEKIKINGQIVNFSHYKLQPGDVITIESKKLIESEITTYLKAKVDCFPKQVKNKTFIQSQLMTLYRTPQHYSFFIKLIKLNKKLKKNILRDRFIYRQYRKRQKKKQKITFFFNKKQIKREKKLRKKKIKKFLFKLNCYLKKNFFRVAFLDKSLRVLIKTWKNEVGSIQKWNNFISSSDTFFFKKQINKKRIRAKSHLSFLTTPLFLKKKSSQQAKVGEVAFFTSKSNNFFLKTLKKKLTTKDLLKIRKHFILPRQSVVKKAAFCINSMKPLHLEVSYKLLTAIFLFSPQFFTFPVSLDMDLVVRSLSQR